MVTVSAHIHLHVFSREGRFVMSVSPHAASRMVTLHQARWIDKRSLQLTGLGELHPCRTHTARGGPLAAMGRSQVYTQSERARVVGYKQIYVEDRPIFLSAVLDNLARVAIAGMIWAAELAGNFLDRFA